MNRMATEPMTGEATADAPKIKRKRRLPKGIGSTRAILMLIVPAILLILGPAAAASRPTTRR